VTDPADRVAQREAFAARIEEVARAVARARRAELDARERRLDARERALGREPPGAAPPEADEVREPETEPEPDDWGDVEHGRWRLAMLERAARAVDDPRRADELAIYLEALRPLVQPDGLLPASLDAVVSESFRELLP
jgi:hypothetical protein